MFKFFIEQQWKGKDWMQLRLLQSFWCRLQSFFWQVMQMHSQAWAQSLGIKFEWIFWLNLRNQWTNQLTKQLTDQPMNCWLTCGNAKWRLMKWIQRRKLNLVGCARIKNPSKWHSVKRKGLNGVTALSKFLVLLAIFLLASYANAFLSMNQVAGDQVQVNHFIWFKETNKPNHESFHDSIINLKVKHQIKQNNDWNRMHCFLATFHQKEYCFKCQWWMMRSRHARLDQNIFNHM